MKTNRKNMFEPTDAISTDALVWCTVLILLCTIGIYLATRKKRKAPVKYGNYQMPANSTWDHDLH